MRDDCVLAEVGELGQRRALGRTPARTEPSWVVRVRAEDTVAPGSREQLPPESLEGAGGCPTGTLGFRPPEPDKSRVCCPSRPIGGVRRRREQ